MAAAKTTKKGQFITSIFALFVVLFDPLLFAPVPTSGDFSVFFFYLRYRRGFEHVRYPMRQFLGNHSKSQQISYPNRKEIAASLNLKICCNGEPKKMAS